jgi:DNA-directed RNA polymerase sigma subunit (sigma70/sigma32)
MECEYCTNSFRDCEDCIAYMLDAKKCISEIHIILKLKRRERVILNMYYGIGYAKSFTLNEMRETFIITTSRISKIKQRALLSLKTHSKIQKWNLSNNQ